MYANALLTKLELLFEHGKGEKNTEEMSKICSHEISIPLTVLKQDESNMKIAQRLQVDLVALFCSVANFNTISCADATDILAIYPDEDMKYYISKAILRQGKPLVDLHITDAEGCVFAKKGFHWNDCALATVFYIAGEHMLSENIKKAIGNFRSSYEIRKQCLGATHVLTGQAQFEMGRAMSMIREKPKDFESDVLETWRKIDTTEFWIIQKGRFMIAILQLLNLCCAYLEWLLNKKNWIVPRTMLSSV